MNKSQLNAIAYAYKRKQEVENDKKLKDLGLYEVFEHQQIYSNKIFFLRAVEKRTAKALLAIKKGIKGYIPTLFGKYPPVKDIEKEVNRLYEISCQYGLTAEK